MTAKYLHAAHHGISHSDSRKHWHLAGLTQGCWMTGLNEILVMNSQKPHMQAQTELEKEETRLLLVGVLQSKFSALVKLSSNEVSRVEVPCKFS
jgi:hypothetical protein